MKKAFLLILVVLLSVMASVQTAMAQKVTLYSAGSKAYECDIAQLDSIVFSEAQTIPAEEIVVTVDANGNADGEHLFEKINETNFYIDDIKYTAQSGDLVVTGYNQAFFKGTANIISQLRYRGRTMNVLSIGYRAFAGCYSLTSITIPNSVKSIDYGAFDGCSSLTSITIPESVTSIGGSAFSGCHITSVTLKSNNIVSAARDYNSSMKTIFGDQVEEYIIGNSVTSIGSSAFDGCSSLTSIIIPESVTTIGNSAFQYCSSLTSIIIPESVTSIGSSAFSGCRSLTSINIPNSVTSIGEYAFYDCFFKTEFFVNNSSLTSDNNWRATLCDEETSEGLAIKNNIVVVCRPWAVSITIPNNVTTIGRAAFYGCSSLTSITIPESVTSIGDGAFSECRSLTSVTIPESVTSVGYNAFYSCTGLTSITIPENVTSIGNSAFQYCRSLTSITIPNNVTTIGERAFFGCTLLTSITIGSGVTSISDYAFSGCSSLTDVYCYAENVPSTDSYAFYNSPISSATLHVPAGSVSVYKAKYPWSGFGSIVAIE